MQRVNILMMAFADYLKENKIPFDMFEEDTQRCAFIQFMPQDQIETIVFRCNIIDFTRFGIPYPDMADPKFVPLEWVRGVLRR